MAIWTSPNYPEFNPPLSGLLPDGTTQSYGTPWWIFPPVTKSSYTIFYTLKPGYNFVSFPFEFYSGQNTLAFIINPSTYTTINKIISSSEAAIVTDGTWIGSLDTITGTQAYWVNNNGDSDVTLEVRGACLVGSAMYDVDWSSGNNFVSYPLCNDVGLDAAIQHDLGDDRVNTIHTSQLAAQWLGPTSDVFIGSLDTFKQGTGYYVNLISGIDGSFWIDNAPRPKTGHPIWIVGETKPGWVSQPFWWRMSDQMCYYMISGKVKDISGNDCIPGEDWIGIFRGDTCCGSWWYTGEHDVTYSNITNESGTAYVGAGYTTLPCMIRGTDGSDGPWDTNIKTTFGYFKTNPNEFPVFVIYKYSENKYYTAKFYNTSTGALIDMSSFSVEYNEIYIPGELRAVSELT